jgi:hypothetical protein
MALRATRPAGNRAAPWESVAEIEVELGARASRPLQAASSGRQQPGAGGDARAPRRCGLLPAASEQVFR